MKTGGESARDTAKNCFYPIYIKNGNVVRFGKVPDASFHPATGAVDVDNGETAIYPISVSDKQERKWRYARQSIEAIADQLEVRSGRDGLPVIYLGKDEESYRTVWTGAEFNAAEYGSTLLKNMITSDFSFPKSIWTVHHSLMVSGVSDEDSVLDYFAGSGTTGHAVLNLNREDDGDRKFILVEMGAYYHTVLRPRIAKVIYSPDWKDGRAQSHDPANGVSALVKCFAVESYDDALNNLPTPGSGEGALLAGRGDAEKDALIRYALDLEMGPALLDLSAFADPWGYGIEAQLAGEDAIGPHRVDLVETFNYLLGLKVSAYGPIERFSVDGFERAEHEEKLGRLKLRGRLRRDGEGPYVFQRVEGVLNDGQDTRVLVVWRKLTPGSEADAAEKDAAVLDAWMQRHREVTTERSEHRDYHLTYINGPVTLPQPTSELRTVLPIEETFKQRMFEGTEGESV